MKKQSKRLLSIIISVLMVLTSCPLTAFAYDTPLEEIEAAIATYEEKMDGTIYKDMGDAYSAYLAARQAVYAYRYGNNTTVDLSALAIELNNATDAMSADVFTGTYTTSVPSFNGDDLSDDSYAGTAYNNIIYTSPVSGYTATAKDTKANVEFDLLYSNTVAVNDGVSNVRVPVMIKARNGADDKDRYVYGCYPMKSASEFTDHDYISLVGPWYCRFNPIEKEGEDDGRFSFKDQYDLGNDEYGFGYSYETGYGSNQTTAMRSMRLTHQKQIVVWYWTRYDFYAANIMEIEFPSTSNYVHTFQPSWYVCASAEPGSSGDGVTFRGENKIYVINYKALLDKVNQYSTVLSNIDDYDKNPQAVVNFLNAYKTATAINLNSYAFNEDLENNVNACSSAIQSAVEGLQTAYNTLSVSDMSDYNLLKQSITDYKSVYTDANSNANYTVASFSNFSTAYDNAVSAASAVATNGFVDTTAGADLKAAYKALNAVPVASDNLTPSASYVYDPDTKTVTISGSGALNDYESGAQSPFGDNPDIEKVIIGEDVTYIGTHTFDGAENLKEIVVPAGATYGDDAFDGCASLETVTFSSGEIASKDEDDHSAPWYQPSVKSIVITNGVTKIGEHAFDGATNIERLTVPCDIPVNTSSNTNAFAGMTGLKYITISTGLTGEMIDWTNYSTRTPWYGNRNNAELHITVEEGVKNIGAYSFFDCNNVYDINLPSTITEIGDRAFYGCLVLDKVYIYDKDCVIPDSKFTFHELTKIYGYEYSTAESYADKYERNFVQLDAHTHSYVVSSVVPPSCTTKGYTVYTCVKGDDSYNADYVNALNHNYVGVVTPPTCTEGGYTTYTCSRCLDSYVGDYTNPTGHDWVVDPDSTEATCTTGGKITYVCSHDASHTYVDDSGAPLGHDYVVKNVVAPTCTERGYTNYKCSRCDATKVDDYVDAAGHDYKVTVTKQPTCVANGSNTYTCSVCKHSYTEVIPATGNHTWDSGKVIKEPSTTSTGVKMYTCSVCGGVKTEDIAKVKVQTPTEAQANKATVNKSIKKITGITTVSESKKKTMTISFNEVSNAVNYRIAYRKQGDKNWTYKWTNGKTSYTLKKLKNKGLYEFKFAAYKIVGGKWQRGDWSKTSYRYYYKATISKVTTKNKSITVNWKKDKDASYYVIFYSTKKDMSDAKKITVKGNKKNTYTIKKLKKGKKYYVRVRAYKTKAKKNYAGEFSVKKNIKVK